MRVAIHERLGSFRQRGFWLRCFLGAARTRSALTLFLIAAPAAFGQYDCFGYTTLPVSRVQGQVFDPYARPIPGVDVHLMQDRKEVALTRADDQGRFSLKISDGNYELRAEAPGFEMAYARLSVGKDLVHTFRPSTLWLILGVGMIAPCPSSTVSHKKLIEILRDWKKENEGLSQKNATQK